MATAQSYQVILGAEGPAQLNYNQDSGRIIGFNLKKSGNKSTQAATITLNNEDGSVWNSELPARSPVTISIEGVEAFNGFVDNIAISDGTPGQLTVECVGRTARLKDSPTRPVIYGLGASGNVALFNESDFPARNLVVSSGKISVPVGFGSSPIWQVGQISYDNGTESNNYGPDSVAVGTDFDMSYTPSPFGESFGSCRLQAFDTFGRSYGQLATPAAFTFEGFILPTALGTVQVIAGVAKSTGSVNSWYVHLDTSSRINFTVYDSTATANTIVGPVLSNGVIYHIEANWNSLVMHLAVNGAQQPPLAPVNTMFPHQLPLVFGNFSDGNDGFIGYMDDFRYRTGTSGHSGGFIVPTSPYEADEFTEVLEHFDTVLEAQNQGYHFGIVIPRNVDFTDNVILVDSRYNGTTVFLSYEVFRDKFVDRDAADIINELVSRHAKGGIKSALALTGVRISFEPDINSELYTEIGRIRDILGPNYDFYLDKTDTLRMVVRSTTSVRTIRGDECHSASFSTDYAAYANSVTARAGAGVENDIGPFPGYLENKLEDLQPGSPDNTVDALAQGFKALGSRLGSFSFRGKRQTEEDAFDYEVQYNGKRNAIPHVAYGGTSQQGIRSLVPDSVNIDIDRTTVNTDGSTGRIHVKASGAGTAYYSNSWTPDGLQGDSGATTTLAANTYQTITVADLTRKKVKGVAFRSTSTSGVVRFDIYSGTGGTAGTLLGSSEPVTLAAATDREMTTDWFSVYFADAVDVSAQTNISVVGVQVSGSSNWARTASPTSPYAGGSAFSGGADLTSDFTFQFFTVTTVLSEAFAGVYSHNESIGNDIVTASNKAPQYFISNNYVIGSPTLATWTEVTVNVPRILSSVAPAGRNIGFKVEFNALSLSTDPLILRVRESVAFENGEAALTDPSGIVVGDLFDSVGVKAMPYFNPETGTQTEDIAVPDAGRLEIGANYWLVMRDGNVANTKSYFTALYSDGASVKFEKNWDYTDPGASVFYGENTTSIVGDGGYEPTGSLYRQSIGSNTIFSSTSLLGSGGRTISADSETSQSQITAARVIARTVGDGGNALVLVSRNRRNYYFPGKSQTPGLPAVKTGEILIWQFDDADPAPTNIPGGYPGVVDKSGHGFDGYWASVAHTVSDGKFGQAFGNSVGSAANSGIVSAVVRDNNRLGQWLQEDITIGFWFKKTTVDASSCTIRLGSGTAAKFRFKLGFDAAGKLTISSSNGDGAASQTLTTAAAVLVANTYKHIMVRTMSNGGVRVYVDGAFVEDLGFATPPDRDAEEFVITLKPNGTDIKIDEVRIWPYGFDYLTVDPLLQLVNSLAINNPYDSGLATLAFPSESDATDDWTSGETADTVKKNLQFMVHLRPAPYQSDFVVLNLPLNQTSDTAPDKFFDDISSFAHVVSSTNKPAKATGGTKSSKQADFDGTNDYLMVAENPYLHIGPRFTFTFRMTQDVTGAMQPIMVKLGEFALRVVATSSTTSNFFLVLTDEGGTSSQTIQFPNVAVGTGTHDIAISVHPSGGDIVASLYVDTVTAGEALAGRSIVVPAVVIQDRPRARSDYPLMIGCQSLQLDGSGRTDFFDGKLDAILWANIGLQTRFMTNASAGTDNTRIQIEYTLRSPHLEQLIVLGYSGLPVNAYADGKYVVSRDDEDTWTQSLDGTTTDPYGVLAFAMTFDKDGLQCNKRDIAEIARVRSVVEKVFDFPTQDAATLCTIAGGYLDLLKDGLEKGRINIDGTTDLDVGQVVTINYPQKAQFFKEYGIAAIETTVSDGIYRTALQLGEEERGIASLFGTSEVGIK